MATTPVPVPVTQTGARGAVFKQTVSGLARIKPEDPSSPKQWVLKVKVLAKLRCPLPVELTSKHLILCARYFAELGDSTAAEHLVELLSAGAGDPLGVTVGVAKHDALSPEVLFQCLETELLRSAATGTFPSLGLKALCGALSTAHLSGHAGFEPVKDLANNLSILFSPDSHTKPVLAAAVEFLSCGKQAGPVHALLARVFQEEAASTVLSGALAEALDASQEEPLWIVA